MDADVICGSGLPRIISAAARNSFPRCACETITPPTRDWLPPGAAPSITFMLLTLDGSDTRPRLLHVAMGGARIETGLAQARREFIRNHHRPMTTAGASNTNRQIGLSLALVLRQQVIQQISKAPQRLFNLRLLL